MAERVKAPPFGPPFWQRTPRQAARDIGRAAILLRYAMLPATLGNPGRAEPWDKPASHSRFRARSAAKARVRSPASDFGLSIVLTPGSPSKTPACEARMRRNIEVVALGWRLDGKTIGCEAGLIEITVPGHSYGVARAPAPAGLSREPGVGQAEVVRLPAPSIPTRHPHCGGRKQSASRLV